MSHFAARIPKAPKTLTDAEQRALLRVTGEHRDGFRDHVIFSLALGTGLRIHEILALDVGDVSDDGVTVRRRFDLRVFKGDDRGARAEQEAILPDAVRAKLVKFLRWKLTEREPLGAAAPLFLSRLRKRLAPTTLREAFAGWQKAAGFERHVNFHALRHTALTNLYRATKDLRLVQRVARHSSIATTSLYTTPSDEEIMRAVRAMPC